MSSKTTLRSFEELAAYLPELVADPADESEPSPEPGGTGAPDLLGPTVSAEAGPPPDEPVVAEAATPDLGALLAELSSVGDALGQIRRRDEAARARAGELLDRYDALEAERSEAERALARARETRAQAAALAEEAFAEEARTAARRAADRAAAAEAQAARCLDERAAAVARFAAEHDLQALLAERRRREEAEKARAALAAKAERLAGTLAEARKLVAASRFEEAKALLGPAASEHPDCAEIGSLAEIIAQSEQESKVEAAEEALRDARRAWRRDPRAAVDLLASLDASGLPSPLAGHVFGCWAQACARLCEREGLLEPLRYAPDPGRGAVLARHAPGGPYLVVSALGMPAAWQAGSPADPPSVRRAHPLRR